MCVSAFFFSDIIHYYYAVLQVKIFLVSNGPSPLILNFAHVTIMKNKLRNLELRTFGNNVHPPSLPINPLIRVLSSLYLEK